MPKSESLFWTLAGWHDGTRVRVRDDILSPLVSAHEGIHEKLLSETPDGQVHGAFLRALKENRVAASDVSAVKASIDEIFAESVYAHEVFANYLSIKQFPADSESRYIAELTSEYKQYYAALADLLDAEVPTSYLQYVVGWTLAILVFSSPLIERTPALKGQVSLVLTVDEQPNERLRDLIKVLKNLNWSNFRNHLSEVAKQACVEHGLAEWDFFSEHQWASRAFDGTKHSSDGHIVEVAISDELRKWLRPQLPFSILAEDRLEGAFNRLSAMVQERFGVELQDLRVFSEGSGINELLFSRAIWQSRARIKNTTPPNLARGEESEPLDYEKWRNYRAVGVYTCCPPHNSKSLIICFWDQDPDVHPAATVHTFDIQVAAEFLTVWSSRRAQGDQVPALKALVIALQNLREMPLFISQCPALLADPQMSAKLTWYLWDGVIELIHGFAAAGKTLHCGRLDMPEFAEHRGRASQLEYNGVVVFVAQLNEERTLGLFVRAMRHQSFVPIDIVQSRLAQQEKIRWMSKELIEAANPLGTEALLAASTFWDEY